YEIPNSFVRRWAVEVTFEEARRHLGLETQRQWSSLAIARTTPILLALYSIVTLLANALVRNGSLAVRQAVWYRKQIPNLQRCTGYRTWSLVAPLR
ncbi:hypothetical protein SM757_29490, partial [Azohydromonas lata]|nr:hypothetical protein [Azohydromonas lata]